MTIDEMYNELGLFGFDDLDDSQKLLLLNEAYFDIVTREAWPFLETVAQFNAPSGTTKITNNSFSGSPTDVNSVLSFTDMSHNVIMIPERTDVIEKNYKINNLNVYPERYYFIGEDVYLYPAVSGATTYRMFYIKAPSKLTGSTAEGDILIPARHHSIIVYGALVKAFLVNDDPQAAMFQNMFESRYQQMRNDAWMQQYDRTDRVHILTDSYDWNY